MVNGSILGSPESGLRVASGCWYKKHHARFNSNGRASPEMTGVLARLGWRGPFKFLRMVF